MKVKKKGHQKKKPSTVPQTDVMGPRSMSFREQSEFDLEMSEFSNIDKQE